MIMQGRACRLVLLAALAVGLATCGEEGTGPGAPLELFVQVPASDTRAVVVAIAGPPLTAHPASGSSVFTVQATDVTRLVIVADSGTALPAGNTKLAVLKPGDTGEASEYTARVIEAAGTDYQPRSPAEYVARLERR